MLDGVVAVGSRQMIIKSFGLTDAGDGDGGLGPGNQPRLRSRALAVNGKMKLRAGMSVFQGSTNESPQ